MPNLFASVLVARQGLGNMAVSNAFGSNTFNIFIALGFPWMIGTLLRPNCREGGMYGDNPGMLEPTRACYHVNRGNSKHPGNIRHTVVSWYSSDDLLVAAVFGSCLILVGVLTLFLLALGMTRMKLTPMIGTYVLHLACFFFIVFFRDTNISDIATTCCLFSGVGYLIVYGIFIFYLCLSTIDTSWQLPF